MSQPSIPNITPVIAVTRQESITMLLSSIAMNEMSMSHIINAEAEAVHTYVSYTSRVSPMNSADLIKLHHATARLLEEVSKWQWLNLNKLDRILRLLDDPTADPLDDPFDDPQVPDEADMNEEDWQEE